MRILNIIIKIIFECIYLGIIKKVLEKIEKYDLILNRNELSLLCGLVELLDVFNIFSTFMQGNTYPTLNTFVLFYAEIEDRLRKMCTFYTDEDEIIATATQILSENLDERLPLNEECIAAAIIDPRMQRLPMINEWVMIQGMASFRSFRLCIFLLVPMYIFYSFMYI